MIAPTPKIEKSEAESNESGEDMQMPITDGKADIDEKFEFDNWVK